MSELSACLNCLPVCRRGVRRFSSHDKENKSACAQVWFCLVLCIALHPSDPHYKPVNVLQRIGFKFEKLTVMIGLKSLRKFEFCISVF